MFASNYIPKLRLVHQSPKTQQRRVPYRTDLSDH